MMAWEERRLERESTAQQLHASFPAGLLGSKVRRRGTAKAGAAARGTLRQQQYRRQQQ